MIRVNVIIENKQWKKKIKKPEVFFNSILNKFPKKYKFINQKVSFSLLLSNNFQIKKLNKKFRNKNKHTDILSFPIFNKKDLKKNIKNKNIYIGDIVISYEYIYGKKFFKEKKILINTFIHGFLHLLGFDHKRDIDYLKMLKEEEKITKYQY